MRAIEKIDEICVAMKTVAQIKLVRAEMRMRQARLYSERIQQLLAGMAAMAPDHPLVAPRPQGKLGLIVITSDKGLCGSYNMNMIRQAEELATQAGDVSLVLLGRKGTQYFRHRGYQVELSMVPLPGEGGFEETAAIADRIMELYLQGAWARVCLIYTNFLSLTRSRLACMDYLPVNAGTQEGSQPKEMLFEPPPQQLAASILPRYLRSVLRYCILESATSEQGARISAMTSATQNAGDMLRQLNREYNKVRQADITKELIDIVGSAEALSVA
jgi:F-type H+-transporting ATPase subunit gamma